MIFFVIMQFIKELYKKLFNLFYGLIPCSLLRGSLLTYSALKNIVAQVYILVIYNYHG